MRSFNGLGGIDNNSKPKVIAEACENHLGDLNVAIKMIEKSKKCGADIIKFQHHLRDFEMVKGLKMSNNFDEDLYDFLGRCSLKIQDHIVLKQYCDEIGIEYLCTPFCKEAAEELVKFNLINTAKIGSGELLDFRLLDYLVSEKISLILSTGMSTIEEIEKSVSFLNSKKADYALLHCVSEYPPDPNDICLDTISLLREKFPNKIIGFSCHTPSIYTSLAAVTLGASIIEKHVTLDKTISCPDQSVSIDFKEMKDLVNGIQQIYKGRGIREKVFEIEKDIKTWARRILVINKDLKSGQKLSVNNLTTLRAGKGISSEYFFDYIGKKIVKNLPAGTKLNDDMVL